MRTLHLFAGGGGGLYADLILGHTPIAAVEHNAHACAILREREAEGWWPGLTVHEQDVRGFDATQYAGRVDCLAAGFPCQDISPAGKGIGLKGARSGLFSEVVRVAGDCRPEWIFLENSAQITTRGLDQVLCELTTLGVDATWCVLPASAVGADHRRARWWLLCKTTNHDKTRPERRTKRAQKAFANADKKLFNRWCPEKSRQTTWIETERISPWATEPGMGRMAYGVAHRKHRIERLGEGQVPLQAAAAWLILEQQLCPPHANN